MKKAFTILFCVLGLFMLSSRVIAQQYDVPGTYATIQEAFVKINEDVAADPLITDVTIKVAAGTVIETGPSKGVVATVPVVVTIEGDGVGTTFVESFRGERVVANEHDSLSTRFLELTSADVNDQEFILKDITFRYFGRGGNDNGGFISTSSTKSNNITISLVNCVFDRCAAKQGAIIHSANTTIDFTMENCLVIECLTYGGSAFAGPIAIDAGGVFLIDNCTFMSNVRHPWDTRSYPDNYIDKGAGRGGVISVNSGDNKTTDPITFGAVNFTMENTAIINNFPMELGSDSIHPAFHVKAQDTVVNEITLENNIFMGNYRTGYAATDIDILMPETDFITYYNSGNIANTVYYKTDSTYVSRDFDGFVINSELTYTHEFIVFTMDGALPALIEDADGIGHVEYKGDGLTVPASVKDYSTMNVNVYPNPSNGLFEIITPERGTISFEVFNVAGSIIKNGTLSSGHSYLDLADAAKGMYILKINTENGVGLKRLLIQ